MTVRTSGARLHLLLISLPSSQCTFATNGRLRQIKVAEEMKISKIARICILGFLHQMESAHSFSLFMLLLQRQKDLWEKVVSEIGCERVGHGRAVQRWWLSSLR